ITKSVPTRADTCDCNESTNDKWIARAKPTSTIANTKKYERKRRSSNPGGRGLLRRCKPVTGTVDIEHRVLFRARGFDLTANIRDVRFDRAVSSTALERRDFVEQHDAIEDLRRITHE